MSRFRNFAATRPYGLFSRDTLLTEQDARVPHRPQFMRATTQRLIIPTRERADPRPGRVPKRGSSKSLWCRTSTYSVETTVTSLVELTPSLRSGPVQLRDRQYLP